MLEIWKVVLDPEGMNGALEKNRFLEIFYDECIGKLSNALLGGTDAKVLPWMRPMEGPRFSELRPSTVTRVLRAQL